MFGTYPYFLGWLSSGGGGGGGTITGGGTANFVAKFSSPSAITNSQIFDNGVFVGINAVLPSSYSERFQVNGVSYFSDAIFVGPEGAISFSPGSNFGIYALSNNLLISAQGPKSIILRTNASDKAVIDPVGSFGLGTTTPTEKFEMFDATAPFALKAFINNSLSTGYAELMMWTDIADMRFGCGGSGSAPYGGSPGDCYFGAVSYSNLILATNNTIRMSIRKDGEVGIGTGVSTPAALFHVLGVNANNINQTLEPVAGVTEETLGNPVSTTDATQTTLMSVPIATDTVNLLEFYVTARKTAGIGAGTTGDGCTYILTAQAKNVGGVVTLGTVQNSYQNEDVATFDATLDVLGTDVRVLVTGAVNDNVNWNVIAKRYKVA